MLLAVGLALAITPREKIADHGPKIDLEKMIPKEFGDWKVDESVIPVIPSQEVKKQVEETYDQMVNRTYVNNNGERMMISIAYGSRQNQKLKAHRQEVCYASQGFIIRDFKREEATVAGMPITVNRMFAINNQRFEPVTYWFTVGDKVVGSHLNRLLVQIQYAFTGSIPDGVLVRVSNISPNEPASYRAHIEFINTMLRSVSPEGVKKLVGSTG